MRWSRKQRSIEKTATSQKRGKKMHVILKHILNLIIHMILLAENSVCWRIAFHFAAFIHTHHTPYLAFSLYSSHTYYTCHILITSKKKQKQKITRRTGFNCPYTNTEALTSHCCRIILSPSFQYRFG